MVFGAFDFGKSDNVEKSFSNLPLHQEVWVTFNLLKIDEWNAEWFYFLIDGTQLYSMNFAGDWGQNQCGISTYNEVWVSVSVTMVHTSQTMVLSFQSSLAQSTSYESYGIGNLNVYFLKNCNVNCLTCQSSNSNICLTCANFAMLDTGTHLCQCLSHFYMETTNYSRCAECYVTCEKCSGPSSSQCLSCFTGDTLTSGVCVAAQSKKKL